MAARLMIKASATEPTAIPPISRSEKRNFRPKRPLIATPISGKRGTNQINRCISFRLQVRGFRFRLLKPETWNLTVLAFQKINLIYPDRLFVAIKRDDNA